MSPFDSLTPKTHGKDFYDLWNTSLVDIRISIFWLVRTDRRRDGQTNFKDIYRRITLSFRKGNKRKP